MYTKERVKSCILLAGVAPTAPVRTYSIMNGIRYHMVAGGIDSFLSVRCVSQTVIRREEVDWG